MAGPAGIPEWPKGAGCKPAGSAFGGSNPPPCMARGNPEFPREPPPYVCARIGRSWPAAGRSPAPATTSTHGTTFGQGYTLAFALLAQSVEHLHGKEGVDGSSPSEGFNKSPANGPIVLPVMARFRCFAGTRRVHRGTSGHSRARATSRDHSLEPHRDPRSRRLSRKTPVNRQSALPHWRDADSLLR
jgi:hypothetical protein